MRIVNKTRAAASIIGIFAGLSGASHGLGEMLQGNIAQVESFTELGMEQQPAHRRRLIHVYQYTSSIFLDLLYFEGL